MGLKVSEKVVRQLSMFTLNISWWPGRVVIIVDFERPSLDSKLSKVFLSGVESMTNWFDLPNIDLTVGKNC